ncbi:hypothetical protein I4U23_022899 [Adineta vaga]|nr:hypothetical protein I4U23_022899 [Adineta vaga]
MIIVMAVQSVLVTIIGMICFDSEKFFELYQQTQSSDFKSYKDIKNLQVDKNFGFYLFLFLLAFLMAAGLEELLKYQMVNRMKRNICTNYQLYVITASLSFSTMENLAYQISAGLHPDSTILDLFYSALTRIFLSIPIHCLCGYLISLRMIRRDIFKQSLSLWNILKWSMFLHGNFNFWILLIAIHSSDSSSIVWNTLVVIFTAVVGYIVVRRERSTVTELQNSNGYCDEPSGKTQ